MVYPRYIAGVIICGGTGLFALISCLWRYVECLVSGFSLFFTVRIMSILLLEILRQKKDINTGLYIFINSEKRIYLIDH
jgi:hypothetical protein